MIQSIKGKWAKQASKDALGKGFPADLIDRTMALWTILDAAIRLEDLRSPPGNNLESLSGDRKGQHSIRINRQWRICFVWTDAGPEAVEIVDYH
ncbi:MAG: type II toxin-antitoxin system RelE/ParE family toxin [Litorimonas sp.]